MIKSHDSFPHEANLVSFRMRIRIHKGGVSVV
jgi:hypothetical protein